MQSIPGSVGRRGEHRPGRFRHPGNRHWRSRACTTRRRAGEMVRARRRTSRISPSGPCCIPTPLLRRGWRLRPRSPPARRRRRPGRTPPRARRTTAPTSGDRRPRTTTIPSSSTQVRSDRVSCRRRSSACSAKRDPRDRPHLRVGDPAAPRRSASSSSSRCSGAMVSRHARFPYRLLELGDEDGRVGEVVRGRRTVAPRRSRPVRAPSRRRGSAGRRSRPLRRREWLPPARRSTRASGRSRPRDPSRCLGGVLGAVRGHGGGRNTRGPSARPGSGQRGPHKPKVKAAAAQRESEGL